MLKEGNRAKLSWLVGWLWFWLGELEGVKMGRVLQVFTQNWHFLEMFGGVAVSSPPGWVLGEMMEKKCGRFAVTIGRRIETAFQEKKKKQS